MRVVVLCCPGLYQNGLVRRLARDHDVVGVVIREAVNPRGSLAARLARYRSATGVARYVIARWNLWREGAVAAPVVRRLFYEGAEPAALPPDVEILVVGDINCPEAVNFVRKKQPDIVCVNGTNLLRSPMLELLSEIPLGIVNLHTGLSPYARGGNCNLFALLEDHPEWVGATIHYIDPGIDSGDIIFSAQVPLDPHDNYATIDAKTFSLGIELLARAVTQLGAGDGYRVPQWTEGKLYLRRTGYTYEPYQRYQVNRLLKQGLIARYLADKPHRDEGIRLVGNGAC